MVWTCSACGRKFDSGATIIGDKVYCPECARMLDDLIDEYISRFMEAKLYGKELPDINQYIDENIETIEKLKLSRSRIKRMLLSSVYRLATQQI